MTTGYEVVKRGAPLTLDCLREILADGRHVPRQGLNPEPIVLRTLEVAVNLATLEAAQATKDLEGWALLRDGAAAAAEHLRPLLMLLGGRPEITIAQSRADRGPIVPDPWKESNEDAEILNRAMVILLSLRADAERRRKSFADERHSLHPDRNAFARIFAESWTFLFGLRPSTTRDNQSAFLRLVTAGMKDWLGEAVVNEQSNNEGGYWLANALLVALKDLKPTQFGPEVRSWEKPSWL